MNKEFLEKIKQKIEPIIEADEEWRGEILFCKHCNTARSCVIEEYNFSTRILCDCQQVQAKLNEEADNRKKNKDKYLLKIKNIGIIPHRYGFDKWETKTDYQKDMLRVAREFLNDTSKSIIITGQSGGGKTFILTSALLELIERGYKVEYIKWLDKGKYLKSVVMNETLYKAEMEKIKTADILYIDDFLKVGKNDTPTSADINLAFEILDYRKENGLPIMISCERNLKEILEIDEAVGSRIVEITKNILELSNYKNVENYRLT